ncbi:MAG: DNA methyltransferase [Burkholderiales bacterium]|nr:DNA methyltransferase [Burkholderiales bacterium]
MKKELTLDTLFDDQINNLQEQIEELFTVGNITVKKIIGEFWTSKQRQASTLQEISYRACFKPQLPNYFINKYTKENDVVYDPFGGRGTTAVEAALLGRRVIQNDINPISTIFSAGRLAIPTLAEIELRLADIKLVKDLKSDIDLSMFYEKDTFDEILSLKHYFLEKERNSTFNNVDSWIRMVATNRLTGHSSGFFSVYTMPPNQAVSAESQLKINEKRKQKPPYRDTRKIILKKSKQLLSGLSNNEIKNLHHAFKSAVYLNKPADKTNEIKDNSVSLVVTSPPFLDIVQYKDDNWLRCWFNSIDSESVGRGITMAKTVDVWAAQMKSVLTELHRVVKKNGVIAFEVGEIRNGKIKLDEVILPLGIDVGLSCEYVMINSQIFTKTSNIWGVSNNESGTNSNRIVVFRKK